MADRAVRRSAAGLVLAAALAVCAACTGAAADAPQVADQGYISGDGTVATVPAGERDRPVRLRGTTLDGRRFDLGDHRGDVVVVNVWGSWCPPCIAEAPDLQRVWEETRAEGVQFVGVDFNDNPAAALAHERRFGVTYPSIEDESGRVLLSLRGSLPPRAVPSTLVLDREGRVAARVLGQVSQSTLRALVRDALAEASNG